LTQTSTTVTLTATNIQNTPSGTITGTTVQTALNGLDATKLPYMGATGNVDLNTYNLTTDAIQFKTTPTITPVKGMLYWDDAEKTVQIVQELANRVTGSINKELFIRSEERRVGKGGRYRW